MRRCVLISRGVLKLTNAELPTLSDGEVLVKTVYTSVCRTDRKAFLKGQIDLHMPRVLGHEIAGIIAQSNDDNYRAGERVVLHPGVFCGKCPACESGRDEICPQMQIFGFSIDGGFAEYVRIPAVGVRAGILLPVADELPLSRAVFTEPCSCAVNMLDRLSPKARDSVAIFGAGALGILTAKIYRALGIGEQAFIEPQQKRRKIAEKLGLPAYSSADDYRAHLPSPDIAVLCAPDNSAFTDGIKLLAPGGKLGFFSGLTGGGSLSAEIINQIHYKELLVAGAYGCSLETSRRALALLGGDIVIEDELIKYIGFDELSDDLAAIDTREHIFSVLKFE